MRILDIGGRRVGPGNPCFVIAEAGVNHNGSLDMAKQLVDTAKAVGADAVKFQTFSADRLATESAPKADYQKRNTVHSESQLAMLRKLELSDADHILLLSHCRERQILFLSTPFDEVSADFLCKLGLPAFKTPSGEITNLPYLSHIARFGTPMIVSTGMSTLAEVETAARCIQASGNPPLALLHCVSSYPADPSEVNLRAMQTMSAAFDLPIGFSDHTDGITVALAAVAIGACILEKHLTLDRSLPGPDHAASLEPEAFAVLVRDVRLVESALGSGKKEPTASEAGTAAVARKSLVAARDLPAGYALEAGDIAIKRPGSGLPPSLRAVIVGRRVRESIKAGTLLQMDDFV